MASVESKLKIKLFGKSGKPAKSIKSAKRFELYYYKELLEDKILRQRSSKTKEAFIAKLYYKWFDELYIREELAKAQIKKAKLKAKKEISKAQETIPSRLKKYFKVKVRSKLKRILNKRSGRYAIIIKTYVDFVNPMPIDENSKNSGIKLAALIIKPYLNEFIRKTFYNTKQGYLIKFRYYHALTRNDFIRGYKYKKVKGKKVKIPNKVNRIFSNVGTNRVDLKIMKNMDRVYRELVSKLDERMDGYLGRKFTKTIILMGASFEVIKAYVD